MGLDCVEMVIAVEKEFEIEIPNEEAAKATTVGELAKLTANITSKTKESTMVYEEPLQFIIKYLVEEHGIPRQKINTSSKFVNDLGLD